MRAFEFEQQRTILLGGRLEHADHQHHGVLCDRHLDLRHALADRQRRQQRAERRDQRIDRRCQHLAALEFGDAARVAFAKPDHGVPARVHKACPESRPPAVLPLRALQRRKPGARRDAPDAAQRLAQLLLLDRELRGAVQMLQRAAATHAKMPAARRHALGGRLQHRHQLRFVVLAVVAATHEAHRFARQRAAHEGGLAAAHHALALVVERIDAAGLDERRPGRLQTSGSQALRNCW